MSEPIDDLFAAIRESCPPAIWSQGVELSRSAEVTGVSADDEEIVVRVSNRLSVVSPTVTLLPEDEDWVCDCSPTEDPCAHLVCAAIAVRKARAEGKELPTNAGPVTGQVAYRFARSRGGLDFWRVIVAGEDEHRLERSLAATNLDRSGSPRADAAPADLEVERVLSNRKGGWLPTPLMVKMMGALSGIADVELDHQPVRTSAKHVGVVGRVTDEGRGFLLAAEADPCIIELFTNGVALCSGTEGDPPILRPVGQSGLSGRELQDLRGGRYYDPGRVAELVTSVLPDLRRRLRVIVQTAKLPQTTTERPRLVVTTERDGDQLSVLATIVYGDPPIARVEEERLIVLGELVPLRDANEERRLARRVASLGLACGHRRRLAAEDAVAFATRLSQWRGGELVGDAHEAYRLAPALVGELHVGDADFELSFHTREAEARQADSAGVLRAWQSGSALAPLEGGGWSPIPTDWLARLGPTLADLLAAREQCGELPTAMLPDLGRLCAALDQPPPPELERLRRITEDFAGLPAADLPADLNATLRAYQLAGVGWLRFLRHAGLGAMLADDMGLGKTLQALCVLTPGSRALVVAPTSVVHAWRGQMEQFRPALRWSVYHGKGRALDATADVTLTTYAILRLDADVLTGPRWDTVVLDEAQAIKNPDSQVARAAFRLKADFRLTMTGTPIENRLDELWSQLHFINRGLLGGRRDFQERYARPIADGLPGVAGRLRERIRPFLLRRTKREVAPELPPRTEVVLRCELTEDERLVYDSIRAATRRHVVERLRAGGNVLEALEALLRLRQASCHSGLVPGQEAEGSSKLSLLMETLDEVLAEGHKALVFSQWTSLLDRLEPHLREATVPFCRLDGSTRDRGAVVDGFQADDGPPVMLLSLKAGGTGLTLTAADHVFLLDPWWNPAVEDQAADRAHRIGQDRPVLVHRLVAADTVEERILALQDEKRALAQAALEGADRATSLTRDDLLALLD